MKISRLKIVYTALNIVLFTSVLFIGFTASQAPPYDPWLDVNDDGYGGIDDIVSTAEHFGASGDPTKLCNITNWPMGKTVHVFYAEWLTPGEEIFSPYLNCEGYKQIHILMGAGGLTFGEEVEIILQGVLYNEAHTAWWPFPAYSRILAYMDYYYDIVLYVPAEDIRFHIDALGTTDCYVYLSYYLTW